MFGITIRFLIDCETIALNRKKKEPSGNRTNISNTSANFLADQYSTIFVFKLKHTNIPQPVNLNQPTKMKPAVNICT